MKNLIAISTLSLVLALTDAQLAAAPKLLRTGESKEWGRRQLHRRMTRDGEHDSSSTSMSMRSSESEGSIVAEWSSYQLSSSCLLKYRLNVPEGTNAEECTGCSVSMEVIHDGEAWLGIAFSETGGMVGSEAVIGTPRDGQVQKYNLGGKIGWFVQPMQDDKQTLTEASIDIIDGQTIMKFTKLLLEANEIEIFAGNNIILYARGYGLSFGYHQARMAFDLSLM